MSPPRVLKGEGWLHSPLATRLASRPQSTTGSRDCRLPNPDLGTQVCTWPRQLPSWLPVTEGSAAGLPHPVPYEPPHSSGHLLPGSLFSETLSCSRQPSQRPGHEALGISGFSSGLREGRRRQPFSLAEANAGQDSRDPEGPLPENMSAGRREGQTAQVSGCPGPAGRRRWVGKPSDAAARGRLVLVAGEGPRVPGSRGQRGAWEGHCWLLGELSQECGGA